MKIKRRAIEGLSSLLILGSLVSPLNAGELSMIKGPKDLTRYFNQESTTFDILTKNGTKIKNVGFAQLNEGQSNDVLELGTDYLKELCKERGVNYLIYTIKEDRDFGQKVLYMYNSKNGFTGLTDCDCGSGNCGDRDYGAITKAFTPFPPKSIE